MTDQPNGHAVKPRTLTTTQWRGIDRFEREMRGGDAGMVTVPTPEYRALVCEVRRLRALLHDGIRAVKEVEDAA